MNYLDRVLKKLLIASLRHTLSNERVELGTEKKTVKKFTFGTEGEDPVSLNRGSLVAGVTSSNVPPFPQRCDRYVSYLVRMVQAHVIFVN